MPGGRTRFSMSMLHVVTDSGCVMATLLSVRTAAKRSTGFEDDRKSCKAAGGNMACRVDDAGC